MNFEEAIDFFKEKEQPEDVIALIGKESSHEGLRKIVVGWQKIIIERVPTKEVAPKNEIKLWEWLWAQADPDISGLSEITGVGISYCEQHLKRLKGNRIIYPDGTVSAFATKTLRQMMKEQLKM